MSQVKWGAYLDRTGFPVTGSETDYNYFTDKQLIRAVSYWLVIVMDHPNYMTISSLISKLKV